MKHCFHKCNKVFYLALLLKLNQTNSSHGSALKNLSILFSFTGALEPIQAVIRCQSFTNAQFMSNSTNTYNNFVPFHDFSWGQTAEFDPQLTLTLTLFYLTFFYLILPFLTLYYCFILRLRYRKLFGVYVWIWDVLRSIFVISPFNSLTLIWLFLQQLTIKLLQCFEIAIFGLFGSLNFQSDWKDLCNKLKC